MTQNNFATSGVRDFATTTNWSLGHVPTVSEDAEINSAVVVTSTANEDVNSIGTGTNSTNILEISNNSTFVVVNGTGPNKNSGEITVKQATLELQGGTFNNPGTLWLMGDNATDLASLLLNQGSVTLNGGGKLQMSIGGGVGANQIVGKKLSGDPSFTNVDNTISGDGTIGGDLFFSNDHGATIETNNSTSASGGTLAIQGSAGNFDGNIGVFVNDGIVQADSGGTLIFGIDNIASTIYNEGDGTINLISNNSGTSALKIAGGGVTIQSDNQNGVINLGGSTAGFGDEIISDGIATTLTLIKQTIQGAGVIGDSFLTLDIMSGSIIDANTSSGSLYIGYLDFNPTAVTNSGTIEATNGGTLFIEQNVNNTGTLLAFGGGDLTVFSEISGSGAVDVGAEGLLEIGTPGQVDGNVTFTGPNAELSIGNNLANGGIGGEIVGAAVSDSIDFSADVAAYSASNHLNWQQTSVSAGVLSLVNSSNVTLGSVKLAGSYRTSDFSMSADDLSPPDQGTLATVVNTLPAMLVPDDFNADGISDIFWRNTSDDSLVTWLMNGSAVSSGTYVTYQGNALAPDATWSVAGIGDFNGDGDADVLWRQSSTETLVDWSMNGSVVQASGYLTYQGNAITPDSSWSVAGIGDFNGDGNADILWQQGTTGTLVDWSMNGSVIKADAYLTYQGNTIAPDSSWSVAGIGDFNGDGNADILWRQSTTGTLIDWSMNGSVVQVDANLTYQGNTITPDSSWSVVGVGDFNGDGNADILWRQSGTGSLVEWQMNGSVIQADGYVTSGGNTVAPDSTWSIVEVGNFKFGGPASILWQQSTTGSLVEWQMNGSQIASSNFVTSQGSPIAPSSNFQVQGRPTDFV